MPDIELVSQDFGYDFAQHLDFSADFQADSPITAVTLLFAAQHDLRVLTAKLPVPGDQPEVSVSYTLDLQQYPLRPFAQVEFWWYIEAENGATLETAPVSFSYADNRYNWHHAADQGIQVFWTTDDPALGHKALRIAQDGLERMMAVLPSPPRQVITIYIYPTREELLSALRLAGRDWISGHADLEWGVILVTAGPGTQSELALEQSIPHEVAHFVIAQYAGGTGDRLPRWLDEGLAVGNETRPDPSLALALDQALTSGEMMPLEALCAPFPADEKLALLSYAQSASVVRFLQNRYGNERIRELINAYGDGADCNGGVERALGFTLDRLEADWLADLKGELSPLRPSGDESGDANLLIGLLGGGAVLVSAFYLLRPQAAVQ